MRAVGQCTVCGHSNDSSNCCFEGGDWHLQCGTDSQYTWEQGYHVCNTFSSRRMQHLNIIVPGHGEASRTSTMLKTIRSIRSLSSFLVVTCQIFTYKPVLLHAPCVLTESLGNLWTDFMIQESIPSDYVLLVMDDVLVQEDLYPVLNLMTQYSLDVASYSVDDWHWDIMNPRKDCLFRETRYTDMLATVFTRDAYQCWKQHINVHENHIGWGYDVMLKKNCDVRIAIMDTHTAIHTSGEHEGTHRTYDEGIAFEQMFTYLKNRTLIRNMSDLIKHIGRSNIRCEPRPLLQLEDSSYYKSVTHNGGWRDVVGHMMSTDAVSEFEGRFQLVDCMESTFLWNRRVLHTPWLGIMHFGHNLPAMYPKEETAQGLIQNRNFRKSLRNCRAIIVMSTEMAEWLRQIVDVPVFMIPHPVSNHTCQGIVSEMRGVLFLGTQYRRLGMKQLHTKWSVKWAPGTRDIKWLRALYRRQNQNRENPFSSVERVYAASSSEYFEMLSTHIVVIDLLDAVANNAVLEIIKCNIPAFVSRLPATVEYLGRDYPMFFSNYSELEAQLNAASLRLLMQRTQQYLLQVRTVSLGQFATNLLHVALQI